MTGVSGPGATLETALDRVAGPLADAGVTLSYRQVHVETARDARRVGLSVSPTVRVDGRDVQPAAYTAACEDCTGPGTGEAVPCRRWLHDGQLHDTPPVPLLVGGVLRGAVDASADGPTGEGRLSAALSAYFGETDGDNACC